MKNTQKHQISLFWLNTFRLLSALHLLALQMHSSLTQSLSFSSLFVGLNLLHLQDLLLISVNVGGCLIHQRLAYCTAV